MRIAVLSGKGGTGKTLVSVNLAAVAKISTCIDCDVEEPNGHLFFKPEDVQEEEKSVKIYCVSSKNRLLAMVLCIFGFFGVAGVHRMYVGRWKTGILYTLTLGIFFMGTLYDLYELYVTIQ